MTFLADLLVAVGAEQAPQQHEPTGWIPTLLVIVGTVCGIYVLTHREPSKVSQLRRRQIDRMPEVER